MGEEFFTEVSGPIPFGGLDSDDPLTFKVYEPDRLVLGTRMEDHLRPGVCFWHSFAWPGTDMFGVGTMDRPWIGAADEMAAARAKMAVAFEFFTKIGIPYYCFHDRDVAPEGDSYAEFRANLDALVDDAAGYQERTGVRLLWGTANLFTHPRYQAGAATNPDPEVFAFAAAQVKHMLEVTCGSAARTTSCGAAARATTRSSTPTSDARATSSPGSCISSSSTSTRSASRASSSSSPSRWSRPSTSTTTTPRPSTASWSKHGLEGEFRANIEANHATLAGHSFHHEVAYATANGMLGSIDANRGDPQNGWDTDQFPNSVEDLALPIYEILQSGGIAPGGFNFDAKLRRQSTRPDGPVPRPHRRSRHARPGPAGRGGPRGARRAGRLEGGALRRMGRPPGHGHRRRDRVPRVARGQGRRRRDRPRRASPAARSASRTSSTDRSGRPAGPARRSAPSADADGLRHRDRRLHHRDQGRPDRRARGGRRRRHHRIRLRCPAPAVERAVAGPVVGWRGGVDPLRARLDRRAGRRCGRGRVSPARCTGPSCSTPAARSSGRRSSGTTSGRRRPAMRSARPSGRSASSRSPATTP